MSSASPKEADNAQPATGSERIPCRGCTDDCRLRNLCNGAPWRLTREQQDEYLARP